MTETAFVTVNFDTLREALQAAGYRVETVANATAEIVSLRSSTGGLAFDIYPVNRLAGDAGFADIVFAAALQTQENLPLEVANRWNATRRFGRLSLTQAGAAVFLVLNMDVLVAGGVTAVQLRSQIEVWDALAQDLVAFLRDELRRLAAANGIDASAQGGPFATETYHAEAS